MASDGQQSRSGISGSWHGSFGHGGYHSNNYRGRGRGAKKRGTARNFSNNHWNDNGPFGRMYPHYPNNSFGPPMPYPPYSPQGYGYPYSQATGASAPQSPMLPPWGMQNNINMPNAGFGFDGAPANANTDFHPLPPRPMDSGFVANVTPFAPRPIPIAYYAHNLDQNNSKSLVTTPKSQPAQLDSPLTNNATPVGQFSSWVDADRHNPADTVKVLQKDGINRLEKLDPVAKANIMSTLTESLHTNQMHETSYSAQRSKLLTTLQNAREQEILSENNIRGFYDSFITLFSSAQEMQDGTRDNVNRQAISSLQAATEESQHAFRSRHVIEDCRKRLHFLDDERTRATRDFAVAIHGVVVTALGGGLDSNGAVSTNVTGDLGSAANQMETIIRGSRSNGVAQSRSKSHEATGVKNGQQHDAHAGTKGKNGTKKSKDRAAAQGPEAKQTATNNTPKGNHTPKTGSSGRATPCSQAPSVDTDVAKPKATKTNKAQVPKAHGKPHVDTKPTHDKGASTQSKKKAMSKNEKANQATNKKETANNDGAGDAKHAVSKQVAEHKAGEKTEDSKVSAPAHPVGSSDADKTRSNVNANASSAADGAKKKWKPKKKPQKKKGGNAGAAGAADSGDGKDSSMKDGCV